MRSQSFIQLLFLVSSTIIFLFQFSFFLVIRFEKYDNGKNEVQFYFQLHTLYSEDLREKGYLVSVLFVH